MATHKPRMVGMNHVAIEVGDIEEALAFYGRIFDFTLRGKGKQNAFIDMGDQFINLTQVSGKHRDSPRHFGLVVDDRSAVRELVSNAFQVATGILQQNRALLDRTAATLLETETLDEAAIEHLKGEITKAPMLPTAEQPAAALVS